MSHKDGGSIALPDEIVATYGLKEGDDIKLTFVEEGGLLLQPISPTQEASDSDS